MDTADDVPQIRETSRQLSHIPLYIHRDKERSTVERVNDRLKDEFGERVVRIKEATKMISYLMFGIVALTK